MRKLLTLIVFISVLLGACTTSPASPSHSLQVLTSESFLGEITQNIAGERLTVDTLLQPGVDPHSFEPTPQDIAKISESQILIVNGLGYETWLSKALQNLDSQQSLVIASNGLSPKVDPSGEHANGDPHLWMNPLNVVRYVENIRDGLVAADPAGKQAYTQNAEIYIAKLKELDQWIKTTVSEIPVEKRLLVTNHDSLGYLAQAYEFKVVGAVIPSITNGAAPSARQMTELIDAIKQSGVKAIFLDIGENQALADQIASETGLKVITNLYVETLSKSDGPAPTYIKMMKHNIEQIVTALK